MAVIEEKGVIKLEIDDSESKGRFAEIKNDLDDVKKKLKDLREAGEVGSEGYKALQREQKELNAELKTMRHNVDVNTASYNQLNDALRFWQKELKGAKQGSEEYIAASKKIEEIKPRVNELAAEYRGLGAVAEKNVGAFDSFKLSVMSVFTGTGLLELAKAAGQAFLDFGKEVFTTTAKFEKYEAVLKNSLGTSEAASQAMGMIKKFAAETPFSVDELTDSYIKYVNRGLKPSMEEMTKLGDIAASQGKSFDQLTEAVLDAGTGEFERLKEFGIQAHKNGEVVEMSFKGITKEVKNTPEAIQAAVLSFGEMEGVAGSMAAISQTLEGRMSNLGDGFDSMKLAIGDRLMPVFGFLIEMFSTAVSYITDLISGNIDLGESSTYLGGVFEALGKIFSTIYNVVSEIVKIGIELFGTLWEVVDSVVGLSGTGSVLTGILNAVGGALKIVGTVAIAALAGVQVLADGLLILMNKGKEVANFFGAEFKINPAANFDTLAKNATENFGRIEKMWSESSKSGADAHVKEVARTTEAHGREAEKQTDKEKKEAEKRIKEAEKLAKDKEKAEGDLLKKIEDMGIKAIADDTVRKIAKADLDYKREQESVRKSIASDATKAKTLEVAEKLHTAEIVKIKADGLKKEEKDKADAAKKDADEAKKKEAEEKKIRAEKLKLDKELLDNEFKAEIEKAKLSLSLTKDNSTAQYNAMKALKDKEWEYKSKQLQAEATAEKARIAESIKDKAIAANAIKNVEAKLNAELTMGANKLASDKKKIDAEALADRRKKNDEFYGALRTAMSGDLSAMMQVLQSKNVAEEGSLAKRLQANMQHIQGVGNAMLAGLEGLTKLNVAYTEGQIGRLDKEKNANFKKLDDEFSKGKITKEELEKAKTGITEKYDAEVLELKKKEFERNKKMQIAMALIQGSMAVLSALATPPFPLGIAMAIVAGVKTAIDINKIKNTQFQASSGYIQNAGVMQGDRHGSEYGKGGISMINRRTGEEIGEAEGGEAFMILSRETTKNNGAIINRLMKSSLFQNGAPIMAKDGTMMNVGGFDDYYQKRMYASGGYGRMFEYGGYGSSDGGGESSGSSGGAANANDLINENKKISEDMKASQEKTAENTGKMVEQMSRLLGISERIANKPSGVSMHDLQGAMNSVANANRKSDM